MRTPMVSPMYLLTSKLLAAMLVSILQVFVYLAIASLFFRIRPPVYGMSR